MSKPEESKYPKYAETIETKDMLDPSLRWTCQRLDKIIEALQAVASRQENIDKKLGAIRITLNELYDLVDRK